MNKKFDFNDFVIEPAIISEISSRKDVNPFDNNGFLPLIASPMDTVVNLSNYKIFLDNKIKVSFPRKQGIPSHDSSVFRSLSLDEFIYTYIEYKKEISNTLIDYILIDIANGHMSKLIQTVKEAKEYYGDKLFLMVGNIANPYTFKILSEAGADAVRVGIGNGNGCSTTINTKIGYPLASLIHECYLLKLDHDLETLIIADGGMKNFSDLIASIALGADYIMIGSLFNKALESCGETRFLKYFKLKPNKWLAKWLFKHNFKLIKQYYGMSTHLAQLAINPNAKIKTSEGIITTRPVEYTLSQWSREFENYLRSAMSYTNSKTLNDFRGGVNINFITEQAFKRFDK